MTSSGTLPRPWGGHCFSTPINNVEPLKGIKQLGDIIQFVFLKLLLAMKTDLKLGKKGWERPIRMLGNMIAVVKLDMERNG